MILLGYDWFIPPRILLDGRWEFINRKQESKKERKQALGQESDQEKMKENTLSTKKVKIKKNYNDKKKQGRK